METMRVGSTRIIRAVEAGVLEFEYLDTWSAFDRGSSKQLIPHLGMKRCACAVESFMRAKSAGLPTHFIEQVESNKIHVREFAVPNKKSLSGIIHGDVIPLEWIFRLSVKGSLMKRLREGTITPEALGFAPGSVVHEGMMLPSVFIECTTKYESIDRHLSSAEARDLAELHEDEWYDAKRLIVRAVRMLDEAFLTAGFSMPDGKFELGITNRSKIVLVDVFGTPDENRIIDLATGDVFSKDIIRDYLNTLPWKLELDAAKAAYPNDKTKWPEYPVLPDDIVELVSRRYHEVMTRYLRARVPT